MQKPHSGHPERISKTWNRCTSRAASPKMAEAKIRPLFLAAGQWVHWKSVTSVVSWSKVRRAFHPPLRGGRKCGIYHLLQSLASVCAKLCVDTNNGFICSCLQGLIVRRRKSLKSPIRSISNSTSDISGLPGITGSFSPDHLESPLAFAHTHSCYHNASLPTFSCCL